MASKIRRFPLLIPSSDEALSTLEQGLMKEFGEVSVRWTTCPDLTAAPFCVVSPGLCGNTKIIQAGGVKNLLPLPKFDKRFNLKEIAADIGCEKSLFIGAGAGPFFEIGKNSEMITNLKFSGVDSPPVNGGFLTKTVEQPDSDSETHVMEAHRSERFGLLGDFFVSDGADGQVLEVRVKTRIGATNFIDAIYNILSAAWPKQSIGLGGVFAAKSGLSKIHVMPEFSKVPLENDADVNRWLQFFKVGAPFVAYGSLLTNDPGYDIRPSHFHGCNRQTQEGGHFHIDVDPKDVEYLAYFCFSEEFIRYDQPQ